MTEIRAFAIAPLPAALLGSVVSWAASAFARPVAVFVFYLLLLYAVQALIGYAIQRLLRRAGRTRLWHFAAGGTAMVALPAAPYLAWVARQMPYSPKQVAALFVLWLFVGALTGAVYWLLARPDRTILRLAYRPEPRPIVASVTPVEHYAAQLLEPGEASPAREALWSDLVEEAERIVALLAPGAFCKPSRDEQSLACMIAQSDGPVIGEEVSLHAMSEDRLRGVGERLNARALLAAKAAARNRFKKLV